MSWAAFWWGWIIVVLVSFGISEYIGIRRKNTAGSLSYQVWRVLFFDHEKRLEGKYPNQPRSVIYWIFLGMFIWLVAHFFLGGRLG